MQIKNFKIEAFRGLEKIELNDLPVLCLVTGDNSAGKTALLEALYLIFGLTPQTVSDFPKKFRSQIEHGDSFDNFWKWLLPGKDILREFRISALSENGAKHSVVGKILSDDKNNFKLRYLGNNDTSVGEFLINANGGAGGNLPKGWPRLISPNLNSVNHAQDAVKYNSIVLDHGGEDRVLNLMVALDNRITRIRYLKITHTPLIYIDLGLNHFVPVSQMGEAFSRVFSLYLTLIFEKPDIIILDEIENGIHADKMSIVWKGLAEIAHKEKIQIIATTHSKECVKAAFEAVGDNEGITTRRYTFKLKNKGVEVTSADSFLNEGA